MNNEETKINDKMFADLFKNLKSDTCINPTEIFSRCIDSANDLISASDFYYENYKAGLDLLNVSENNLSLLPEFILLAYLESSITYDFSKNYVYNNKELRQIIETTKLSGGSNFANHITKFKKSYSQNTAFIEHSHNYLYTSYDFQTFFFNFLTSHNIIKSTATDFEYAVPLTIMPLFILIINTWEYSPSAYIKQNIPGQRETQKPAFINFINEIQKKSDEHLKPDKSYQLFINYFLKLFFDNTYITSFVKSARFPNHFEHPADKEELLRKEWNTYDMILCKINRHIPFLSLKKIYVHNATDIYNTNTEHILAFQTDYTEIKEITDSVKAFIKILTDDTSCMIKDIKNYVFNCAKKNTSENEQSCPSMSDYFESLDEILTSYTNTLNSLIYSYKYFLSCFYTLDHSIISTDFNGRNTYITDSEAYFFSQQNSVYPPLKTETYKYKMNYDIIHLIDKFLKHIQEFLNKSMIEHHKRLEKKYSCMDISNAAPSLYKDLKKINGFISTLENNLIKNPPIQEYASPMPVSSYDLLADSIQNETAVYAYTELFYSFYENLMLARKITSIPLWHTLHLYIADNLKIFNELLEP